MAARLPPLPPAYAQGLELIDEAHALDPNKTDGPDGPESLPYELHYARKMTEWLAARCPSASPELQLACRAQHFKRYADSGRPPRDVRESLTPAAAGGSSRAPASP